MDQGMFDDMWKAFIAVGCLFAAGAALVGAGITWLVMR